VGIVLGVVLVVAGAILLWALHWNISYVDDNTLGLILLIAGIGTILVSLLISLRGHRTTGVESHRYEEDSRGPA